MPRTDPASDQPMAQGGGRTTLRTRSSLSPSAIARHWTMRNWGATS